MAKNRKSAAATKASTESAATTTTTAATAAVSTTPQSSSKSDHRANVSSQQQHQAPPPPLHQHHQHRLPATTISLREWLTRDRRGIAWVATCLLGGMLIGFVLGTGWLEPRRYHHHSTTTTTTSAATAQWRQELGDRIRATSWVHLVSFQGVFWEVVYVNALDRLGDLLNWMTHDVPMTDPTHPRVFSVLREAIVRERGGFVHPDLGFLMPAPSGSPRGLGMVLDSYQACQSRCMPGTAEEKLATRRARLAATQANESFPIPNRTVYHQEEILVRVPLTFQITRKVALDTLLPLIPAEVQQRASLEELDDAALLTLLLAHERGVGRWSRWLPYIMSLPTVPTCGYWRRLRPQMLDAISALREELGVPTEGWVEELHRATQYAESIASRLANDYGPYLKTHKGVSAYDNIAWSLCQVASRATAGSDRHGSLRLVPMVDQVNHDVDAAALIELSGKERILTGDFVTATENDSGTFVIRSMRHGRPKPLRLGQELLVNYNVPHFSPLDWFVGVGFVPLERQGKWQRLDPALPRVVVAGGSGGSGDAPTRLTGDDDPTTAGHSDSRPSNSGQWTWIDLKKGRF